MFLPWCCAASSDRESVGAGAGAVVVLELQFECSWIRSDNEGLPLESAILARPEQDWLTLPVARREPRLSPEGAKEGLVAVVIELFSERLLRGTERRDDAELWAPGDILKDAKVPSERLLWLHIMDDGDRDPLLRVLNDGSPKLRPVSLSSFLPCMCPAMSCDRLRPLKSGRRLGRAKPPLSELLPDFCRVKSSCKLSVCCFVHCCASTGPSVWTVSAPDVMSV